MIRLIVPEDLPSMSTSRGATTVASATAGFVTAMRVMSKSVCRTVERPAVRVMRSTDVEVAGGGGAACAPAGGVATGACAGKAVRETCAPHAAIDITAATFLATRDSQNLIM